MSQALAKYIGKRVLGETIKNNFGHDDPYFEMVPATRLNGTPSRKFKKRRKALPPGISEHDGKVLTKVKRRAYRLDMSLFNCCGVRFGWGSVIGIIPFIGDGLDAFMAFMVYHTCQQVEGGLPTSIRARMLFNILLDFGIGLVPVLGDIADALYRCNTRNAALLEQYLRAQGKKNLRLSGQPLPAVDPSLGEEFDRIQANGDPPPYSSRQPSLHPNMTSAVGADRNDPRTSPPRQPAPALLHNGDGIGDSSGGGRKGGLFGFGRKSRRDDIETGNLRDAQSGPAVMQKQLRR